MSQAGTSPEGRLAALGIVLPEPPAPAAVYVPVVRSGDLLFVAGQVPFVEGRLQATGKLGGALDLDAGTACARQCAVNVLAQVRAELGSLDHVARVVKLTVFVASDPSFTEQHLVANGASELFGEVFGDIGRHARSAVGVPVLPMDAPVEVEAVLETGRA
ncbi:MAG TPA: RidA family protein [Egibacteraceae bacterium]|nr:RidA family protein [Egibacteraceae bacterium]